MSADLFKSQEERFFWSMRNAIPQLVDEFTGFEVVTSAYEPLRLQLGKVVYTPDFMLHMQKEDKFLTALFETKGAKEQRGYRDTRARLKIAASLYPMFVFVEVIVLARYSRFESFEILTPHPFPYSWR